MSLFGIDGVECIEEMNKYAIPHGISKVIIDVIFFVELSTLLWIM